MGAINATISDFQTGVDRIDFSTLRDGTGAVLDFADIAGAATSSGGTTISLACFRAADGSAASGTLTLTSVSSVAGLSAADFIFDNGVDWQASLPTPIAVI